MYVREICVHWITDFPKESGTLMKAVCKSQKAWPTTEWIKKAAFYPKDGKQRVGWKSQITYQCFRCQPENGK